MSVLLVVGSGPGISHATAARFGREGYSVALVSRDAAHVEEGVGRLSDAGVSAWGSVGDAAHAGEMRAVIERVRAEVGTVSAVLFTAFGNSPIRDALQTTPADATTPFLVGVGGLLAVVQAALPDLRTADRAVVLAANGAVGEPGSDADEFSVMACVDGVALESAAKAKLLGLLSHRLKPEGVHVGEVVINGTIQGSPYATATAIDPSRVAEAFWDMTTTRSAHRIHITEQD